MLVPITHVGDVQSPNSFGMNWWYPGTQVHVILLHGTKGTAGPGVVHLGQGPGLFLLSRLAQVLRGRAVVTRTSFLGLVATLSSRDASRSARRKRTGCVEPYEIRSTRSPALPARTEHPQGGGQEGPRSYQSSNGKEDFWAGRAEGLDNSPMDLIRSTGEGSILEVATFCQSIKNGKWVRSGRWTGRNGTTW